MNRDAQGENAKGLNKQTLRKQTGRWRSQRDPCCFWRGPSPANTVVLNIRPTERSVLFQGTQSVVLVLQQPKKETHVSEWFIFDEIPKMYWLGKNVSPMFTHFVSLEGLQKFLSWDWYGMMIHISILDVFSYNYKGAALLTNNPSILLYLGLKGYQTERSPSLCRTQ